MKQKFLFALAILAGFVALATPAHATGTTTDPVQQALQRVEAVTNQLVDMIMLFTNVVITPMGLSCASRIFRHVVLANV